MSDANEFDSSDDESSGVSCSIAEEPAQENPTSVVELLRSILRVRMIRKKSRRIVISAQSRKSPAVKADALAEALDPK